MEEAEMSVLKKKAMRMKNVLQKKEDEETAQASAEGDSLPNARHSPATVAEVDDSAPSDCLMLQRKTDDLGSGPDGFEDQAAGARAKQESSATDMCQVTPLVGETEFLQFWKCGSPACQRFYRIADITSICCPSCRRPFPANVVRSAQAQGVVFPNIGEFLRQNHPTQNYQVCPLVVGVLSLSDAEATVYEALSWMAEEFLWGHIQNYGFEDDGLLRWQKNIKYTAADKLQRLIEVTKEQREWQHDSLHVLTEPELKKVLERWKDNYKCWMHPENYSKTKTEVGTWHVRLRTQFRAHLFHLSGCYELTLFFIVAPFTCVYLELFHECWNYYGGFSYKNRVLEEAKLRARQWYNNGWR
jgi:hypothetical protein